jgi:hypothetical protein
MTTGCIYMTSMQAAIISLALKAQRIYQTHRQITNTVDEAASSTSAFMYVVLCILHMPYIYIYIDTYIKHAYA